MTMGDLTERNKNSNSMSKDEIELIKAKRTAFLARFIVLRESKRSRAHRNIEFLEWDECTSAEELALKFREVFQKNGDSLSSVDRDIKKALNHSYKSINFFIKEYSRRATTNFVDALSDYEYSNQLLFSQEDEQPKSGGWRLPIELKKELDKR